MSQTATQNKITLKGSTEIVTEFFGFSINSILYQRGIYPPNTFVTKKKYGLNMLITNDEGLKSYLSQVLQQLSSWLMQKVVQRLVVAICSVETGETLERWEFEIQTDKSIQHNDGFHEKDEREIMTEIQAIIRQITSCVTFLPLLNEECTFDLLVYCDKDADVPKKWEESDPKYITNAEQVRLRSFTTKVHKVDALVSYKTDSNE